MKDFVLAGEGLYPWQVNPWYALQEGKGSKLLGGETKEIHSNGGIWDITFTRQKKIFFAHNVRYSSFLILIIEFSNIYTWMLLSSFEAVTLSLILKTNLCTSCN